MKKFAGLFLLVVYVTAGFGQPVFLIGGNAGINACYLGGRSISDFSTTGSRHLDYLTRAYKPGFHFAFATDIYPLKTKKQIFLIAFNLGYQQYAQSISWFGKADSTNYSYSRYVFKESKVNRELFYSILFGFNLKGFVVKTGITVQHTIASSGILSFTADGKEQLGAARAIWPSFLYKQSFSDGSNSSTLSIPVYLTYNYKLNNNICIAPEVIFNFGVAGIDIFNFGWFGITRGWVSRASVGCSFYYTVNTKK